MKNISTAIVFLAIIFFNSSPTIASNLEELTVVPEVIACESEGNCDMTPLALLLQLDQEEQRQQVGIEQQSTTMTKKKLVSQ